MRKIAFIVCIVLMFSACNNTKSNKAENETNNVRKTEQKEVTASLKEVTLSFKDIEIGKNIDKINSSCFKNDGKIKIKSFELISDFVCSAEKLQKTFFASKIVNEDFLQLLRWRHRHRYKCQQHQFCRCFVEVQIKV